MSITIKKQVKMMNKRKIKEMGKTKYLMFATLYVLLMIVCNIEAVARTTKGTTTEIMKVTPQPEQYIEEVTYKGKVVDEDRKPLKNVEIFSNMKLKKEKVIVQEDGSFEFQIMKEAPIIFVNRNGNVPKYFNFTKEQLADVDSNNWIVVCTDQWHDILQHDPEDPNNPIYEITEHMPEFPGGISALVEYLNKNITYPIAAQKDGTQGVVAVQFVVEKNGNISNTKIFRSVDSVLDKEAIRVVNAMPKWKPGTHDGEVIRVKCVLPLTFRL